MLLAARVLEEEPRKRQVPRLDRLEARITVQRRRAIQGLEVVHRKQDRVPPLTADLFQERLKHRWGGLLVSVGGERGQL